MIDAIRVKRDDGRFDVIDRYVAIDLCDHCLDQIQQFPGLPERHRMNILRLQIWLQAGTKRFIDEDFDSLAVVMARVREQQNKEDASPVLRQAPLSEAAASTALTE